MNQDISGSVHGRNTDVEAAQALKSEDSLPSWVETSSQTTFVLSLLSVTILASFARELTRQHLRQTALVVFAILAICVLGAVAGMRSLEEVFCFFPEAVVLALALSHLLDLTSSSGERRSC